MPGPNDRSFNALSAGPFLYMEAVAPSNSVDLPGGVARGLMVFATGDVVWLDAKGNEHALAGLTAGAVIPCSVRRVKSTGTTATVKAGY